jgi:crotonobetainyl-CoA:carnitine CoA-transferase CaiB-like acyl-CoA transferase
MSGGDRQSEDHGAPHFGNQVREAAEPDGAATSQLPRPAGPLSGIRVVELASVIMAPYACQILGDLGADVIKVEDRAGDLSRGLGGGPHPELSGIALNLHRNKRSVQIDLAHPDGRAVFDRLLGDADVFVTNMRPRALGKLGLDAPVVLETHPGLVFCEAHGFSLASGEADRPAVDDIFQSETGLPALNGEVTGMTAFLPTIVADKVAGLTIAYAVLAALVERSTTGRGCQIEVPMFDAVLSFNLVEHLARAVTPGERAGYTRILTEHRGPHRTKDGYVAFLPYSDADWERLYTVTGHADELSEPWFASNETRIEHAGRVYSSLGQIMLERTTDEWLALAAELGAPAGPVPSIDEIVADPARHRGVIVDAAHPVVGPYRHIASPVRFDGQTIPSRSAAPLLGEDTRDVLRAHGLGDSDIAQLDSDGVIGLRRAAQASERPAEPASE